MRGTLLLQYPNWFEGFAKALNFIGVVKTHYVGPYP